MSQPGDCATCRFWMPPKEGGPGECRHRSPRAVEDRRTGAWRSRWPPVWHHDWCGAWQEGVDAFEAAVEVLWEGDSADD